LAQYERISVQLGPKQGNVQRNSKAQNDSQEVISRMFRLRGSEAPAVTLP
jgi:hypothetical protein